MRQTNVNSNVIKSPEEDLKSQVGISSNSTERGKYRRSMEKVNFLPGGWDILVCMGKMGNW